jgi:DNA-directed RNA polymerase specialized sigma24 family protein
MTPWENIINAIVRPRAGAAAALGLDVEELRAIARLAAVEANATWTPGAGASETSWVWQHVSGRIAKALRKAARELAQDIPDQDSGEDLEAIVIIRESLALLQARLDPDDYRLLWLHHALGCGIGELARIYSVSYSAVQARLWRVRKKAATVLGLAA